MEGGTGGHGAKGQDIFVRHGRQAADAVSVDRASERCGRMVSIGKWQWPEQLEPETGSREHCGSWGFALQSTLYHPILFKQGCV